MLTVNTSIHPLFMVKFNFSSVQFKSIQFQDILLRFYIFFLFVWYSVQSMKIHFIDKTRCNSINFFPDHIYLEERTSVICPFLPLFFSFCSQCSPMLEFMSVFFSLSLFSDVMQNHIIISVAKGDKCNLVSSIYFDLFSAMCMREKRTSIISLREMSIL